MQKAPMMYFEDFAVGQRHTSGTLKIDLAAIRDFARQFDPQPFHLDEEAAKHSMFGQLVASGWHTAAATMRLIVDSTMNISGGKIGLGGDITWPKPTCPGDELTVVSEITDVRGSETRPSIGIVTVRYTTLNQNDEAVQVATMKMIVPRRPDATANAD